MTMTPNPRNYVLPAILVLCCYVLLQAAISVFIGQTTNSFSKQEIMAEERNEYLAHTVRFIFPPMENTTKPHQLNADRNIVEVLKLFNNSHTNGTSKKKRKIPLKTFTRPNQADMSLPWTNRSVTVTPRQPYSAIINSYMRGGSSFVGRLLGFHPDSFYFYEPLNRFLLWEYFEDKSKLCHSNLCVCRNGKAFATAFIRHLVNVMYCKGFRDLTSPDITDFYSGRSWEGFTKCFAAYKKHIKRKVYDAPDHCLFDIQNQCSRYQHVIAKVLRLTVDNYDVFFAQTKTIKVFHLFRDPRAIINSRLTTDWFPVNNLEEVKSNARCLCMRMKKDYEAGLHLMKLFPDRFKFLLYEDIVDNLEEKADMMYNLLGLRTIQEIGLDTFKDIASFGIASDHKLRDNSTDFTSWWRRIIDLDIVAEVDKHCVEVYALLGYRKLSGEELRNLSVPHVEKPYRFTID